MAIEKTDVVIVGVGAAGGILAAELGKAGMKGVHVEGLPNCDWVLIDTGDVIVHVFRPEVRSFYSLEKLWAPARSATRASWPVRAGHSS